MNRRSPDELIRRGLKSARRRLGHEPRREDFLKSLPRQAVAAEIGVFRGEFTEFIFTTNRPSELHLIDVWWELHGEFFPMWGGAYTEFGQLSTRQAYEEVLAIVERLQEDCKTTVHVGDDLSILAGFPDQYFDWVYLDTSHQYEQTLKELEILAQKVKAKG
ncbi:MAG TPA: class I SAM-dependent methyltransferase, partial [Acidimicrobiales bacterium]|nr:class I SAM-dependent methyltransferase [Acidimicrobiales bacterium]